jgi:hypothetical protein
VAVIDDQGIVLEGSVRNVIGVCLADCTPITLIFLNTLNIANCNTVPRCRLNGRTARLTGWTILAAISAERELIKRLGHTATAADLLSQY